MWALVLSLANSVVFNPGNLITGLINLTTKDIPSLFPVPPMIISVNDPKETQTARLIAAGFQTRSHGTNKAKLFTGPGTMLNIINRILYYSFMVLSNPTKYDPATKGSHTPERMRSGGSPRRTSQSYRIAAFSFLTSTDSCEDFFGTRGAEMEVDDFFA